ncbi:MULTISPECIES: IclR family transcriptional regulator [unclassified Haladaptatus]|uniref:IclR family transcriptional regulator n=1 Tax=unclassified Haladaptatus TaxID=2622732 RepID=UPI00209C0AAF|nr:MULTISPECIES: IclR family transcriptional regulator [unclassified Haladaptatus]MCO8243700.1 IclR family transcriptional regulator [Haladaptatus sp. AB643]MCO8255109.1 IclR family transcriptional regulator [Haladaptatus sp. AB618]
MDDGGQTSMVSAPKKTFALITTMANRGGTVGISELADALEFTRSTTYKHLATLRELGYVEKDGVEYSLSYRFLEIGSRIQYDSDLYRAGRPAIDRLATTTDETASLVVKQGSSTIDLYQSTDTPSKSELTDRYLHCTAAGKAILARLSPTEIDAILDDVGLPERTDNTITDRDRLERELDGIRDRGIAIERGEQHPERNGIAVALEHDGDVAAVYVAGHADRLSSKRLEENVPGLVLGTVRQLKTAL